MNDDSRSLHDRPTSGVFERATSRVLVVDDDPMLLKTWTRVLASHHVIPVPSVATARRALDAWSVDLVITDLFLGDGTGVDVHRAAIALLGATAPPFVVLTGGGGPPEYQDYLKANGIPCLNKPLMPHELREVVARVVFKDGVRAARTG